MVFELNNHCLRVYEALLSHWKEHIGSNICFGLLKWLEESSDNLQRFDFMKGWIVSPSLESRELAENIAF